MCLYIYIKHNRFGIKVYKLCDGSGHMTAYLGKQLLNTASNFFLNNQPDAQIIPILFCYKTLRDSGIFSAHHQEFSTVHAALVSFTHVSDDRFQAESGWNVVQ